MKAKLAMSCFAIGLGVFSPTGGAVAQEAGTFLGNVIRGIGITPRERDPIDYRERPPLVVPPKMNLPPPQPPGQARNGAWPQDPDLIARREARIKDRKPIVDGEDGRDKEDARLDPRALRADRTPAGSTPPSGPLWGPDRGRDSSWVSPVELGRVVSEPDEPVLKAGETPKRRRLTDPPSTYRTATQKIAPKSEPITRDDEADPKKFIREEALRR